MMSRPIKLRYIKAMKKKVGQMEDIKASVKSDLPDRDPTVPESLTQEELHNILRAKSRAVQLTLVAEKAVAEARVAELEAEKAILVAYNKYQLNQSVGDSISDNGLINRVRNNPEKQ